LFKGFVLAVEQVDFVIQRGQHLGYGFLFGEGWDF
jgi:sensor c-di-GMP phosphodiesterase-like protein